MASLRGCHPRACPEGPGWLDAMIAASMSSVTEAELRNPGCPGRAEGAHILIAGYARGPGHDGRDERSYRVTRAVRYSAAWRSLPSPSDRQLDAWAAER